MTYKAPLIDFSSQRFYSVVVNPSLETCFIAEIKTIWLTQIK